MKPDGAVEIAIEDVQQQNGCNNCGLFALVFATALCSNINPNSLVIAQQRLREALMRGLKECDMSYFLQNACDSRSREFNEQSLFNMRSLVYCHCKLPDDGKLMIKCKKCMVSQEMRSRTI